jgi:prevent-host-death family protein
VLSDGQPIAELRASELQRSVAAALARVAEGERLIITRHGQPVAVLVSAWTGIDLALAGSERYALLRAEAREELEQEVTAALASWRAKGFSGGLTR